MTLIFFVEYLEKHKSKFSQEIFNLLRNMKKIFIDYRQSLKKRNDFLKKNYDKMKKKIRQRMITCRFCRFSHFCCFSHFFRFVVFHILFDKEENIYRQTRQKFVVVLHILDTVAFVLSFIRHIARQNFLEKKENVMIVTFTLRRSSQWRLFCDERISLICSCFN